MASMWQDIVILSALGLAVVYLAGRLFGRRKRRSGCSECRLMKAIPPADRGSRSD